MKYTTAALALGYAATTVSGHGFVTSPQPRMPGDALASACGQQVYSQQSSDNYGNIQGELQVVSTDYDAAACHIWLCKGYQFADNKDNVQTYTAGETVPITVDIRAPHTGVANVSIVDTSTNAVIGDPLISWDVYASNSYTIPENQTSFDITIPSDLGSKCSTAGACVIQWYWNAASIDQTYESCIDFTVGGSGSGSGSESSSPVASSTAVVSSTAAVSSAPATTPEASSTPIASSAVAASTPVVSSATTPAVTPSAYATPSTFSTVVATTAAPVESSAAPVISAISQLPSVVPSGVLSSVLPTVVPTSAAGSGSGVPSTPLPEGMTVKDILEWFYWMLENMLRSSSRPVNKGRHSRDFS